MSLYNKVQYISFSIIYTMLNGPYPKFNFRNLAKIFHISYVNNINLFELSKTDINLFFKKYQNEIFTYRQKNISEKLNEFIDLFSNKEELLKKTGKELDYCEKNNIKLITYEDEKFPQKLKTLDNIEHPVYTLYYKGNLLDFDKLKCLAIVGSRKTEKIGQQLAENIPQKFSNENFVIISGLALGTDTYAHIGALKANLPTAAILGQGLYNIEKKIYPQENKDLGMKIIENSGMILSEIPPSRKLNKNFLIFRNRIQVALSDYVIVIETAEKGGTMKTITYAEKLNKPILIFNPTNEQLEKIKKTGSEIIEGNIKLLHSKNKKFYPFSNENDAYKFINSQTNFLFPELNAKN